MLFKLVNQTVVVQENFISQNVNFLTHNSRTMPDLVHSSNFNIVSSVKDVVPLGSSDHVKILVHAKMKYFDKSEKVKVRNLKRADFQAMEMETTVSSREVFRGKLNNLVEDSVPLKVVKGGNNPPWMQKGIMKVIRKKRKLWKTYSNSKEFSDYLPYKQVEKKLKIL